MPDNELDVWKDRNQDFVKAHYGEVGEEARFYDRLIWEIPSIAIGIMGALMIAAFSISKSKVLTVGLLVIAGCWNFAVWVAAKKHMFFCDIQKTRLMELEDQYFKIPNLQRFTTPGRNEGKVKLKTEHWRLPTQWAHRRSAHRWLLCALMVSLVVILVALVYAVLRWPPTVVSSVAPSTLL